MDKKNTVRGQILISDLIISLSIFLLLIAIAYEAYNRQTDRLAEWHTQILADEAVQRGLASIVDAQGNPTNWAVSGLNPGQSQLMAMGAGDGAGSIDQIKLTQMAVFFNSSTYDDGTLEKMGLGYFQGDVNVSELAGADIISMGLPPISSSIVLSSGTRVASYNGRAVLVRLRVWRNES